MVARNWRSRSGEIDLIVRKDRLLVFCEVKTRTSERFGAPVEAVTPAKVRRIRRLAAEWLASVRSSAERPLGTHGFDLDLRFDVASVMSRAGHQSVEVIESAF